MKTQSSQLIRSLFILSMTMWMMKPGIVVHGMEVQDYTYTVTNGLVTITKYTGSGGAVTIPDTIIGLPVTAIGDFAFSGCFRLTSVMIPNSVTSIGDWTFFGCTSLTNITIPNSVIDIWSRAFSGCSNLTSVMIPSSVTFIDSGLFSGCSHLTNVTIPNSVISIGYEAFWGCSSLTSVIIPDRVVTIGVWAFSGCSNLTSVTIPKSVTSIDFGAFSDCSRLTNVYFEGNAPSDSGSFAVATTNTVGNINRLVFYLPDTTGWGSMFSGCPTMLWNPKVQTGDASFGVQTNGFGFTVTGNSNLLIVVEASIDLANPTWIPLQTNTPSGDSFYFSDPQWTNYPCRFYRLNWP